MTNKYIKLGIIAPSQCHYLPAQKESIAIVLDEDILSAEGYSNLIQSGFRRSGNNIYRPYCDQCKACHSLRVSTLHFRPTKSQKRQLNQLKRLDIHFSDKLDENWFTLYQRYINARHRDGTMYPANKEDFLSFIQNEWQHTQYLHIYEGDKLIAVAATDIIESGYSAIYSFFDPEHPWSLGSLCVLAQLEMAKYNQQPWLYLGFQIDPCTAMNYKEKFKPNQRYISDYWVDEINE